MNAKKKKDKPNKNKNQPNKQMQKTNRRKKRTSVAKNLRQRRRKQRGMMNIEKQNTAYGNGKKLNPLLILRNRWGFRFFPNPYASTNRAD